MVARLVTLRTPEDEKLIQWKNVTVDACNSHTEIHTPHETITLLDEMSSFDLFVNKCVIYFKTGFYLVVIR